MDTIETFENPKGIIAVSGDSTKTTIAFPDKTKGYVRIKSYGNFNFLIIFLFLDKAFTTLICAHESNVAALSLNLEGTLLATSSEKVI